MLERRRPLVDAGLLLSLLLSVAFEGCQYLTGSAFSRLALLPGIAAIGLALSPRRRLQSVVHYAAVALVVSVFVLSFIWSLYPVVSEATLRRLLGVTSIVLTLVAGVALLGRSEAWPAWRTFLPAALALVLTGALPAEPTRASQVTLVICALLLFSWLLVDRSQSERRSPARRLVSGLVAASGVALLGGSIARFLPWAQPMVESGFVNAMAMNSGTAYAGLSFTSSLGDIEELALSENVVMRVRTLEPQRLRARVFTRFDGVRWSAQPAPGSSDLLPIDATRLDPELQGWLGSVPGAVLAVPGHEHIETVPKDAVRTRIVQTVFNGGALVSPTSPILVALPGSSGGRVDNHGILTPSPASNVEIYAILNRQEPVTAPPPEKLAELLEVPKDLDDRFVALAARLGEGDPATGVRVARITDYLGRECRYSLKVGRFKSRQPVTEFLFEKKRGYCEYFASAAVLLLRLQGVPARYVTGFNVRDDSMEAGQYVVRESHAHAWIEVYMTGRGWVEVDPTPSAQYDAVHARGPAGILMSLFERGRAFAAELVARFRAGDWTSNVRWLLRAGARPALVLGAVALALHLARRRRRASVPGAPEIGSETLPVELLDAVRRLDTTLESLGHRRPASRALREHLDRIPAAALPEPLRQAGARVIDCYYRARFGGVVIGSEEIRAARDAFERARPASG